MLGKLLKYDFRAGGMAFPLLYVALGALYLIGLLAKHLRIEQFVGTMVVAIAIVAIAAMVLAIVFAVTRYHKGLFGAEGYLTQTLPVGKGVLVASKALTAGILLLLGYGAVILAVLAVVNLVGAEDLVTMLRDVAGQSFWPLLLYLLGLSLAQLLAVVGELFFAITLANTRPFLKNNVIFSVVFFFAGNMAVSFLELAGMMLLPVGVLFTAGGASFTFETMLGSLVQHGGGQSSMTALPEISMGLGSLVIDVAAGLALLFLSRWLMAHKTSVK